jgi:hypothetical protein
MKYLVPRVWISLIVVYNVICGVLAIVDPARLDALFPGSASIFGTETTMLSRVLGSYALSIAGVRTIFVLCPTSSSAFWSVIWTFLVFESMFTIEIAFETVTLETVAFGVVAGTLSCILLFTYKLFGWLSPVNKIKGA